MNLRLSDLWSLRGTVDRGTYAFWGIALALVKYNVDRVIVGISLERLLRPLDYWFPGDLFGVFPPRPERATAAIPLVLIALPFVWAGVALTLRRLRAVGLPAGLVLLFFVPVVNLLLFAILCVLPSRVGEGAELAPRRRRWIELVIPQGQLGSAVAAIAIVIPVTGVFAWVSADALRNYGWGLFVGLPFFLGLAAAVLHAVHGPRSLASCLMVAWLATVLLAGLCIALAFEGVICVMMAAPIAIVLATLGAVVGHVIQMRPGGGRDADSVVSSMILVFPALLGMERWTGSEPESIEVRSSVEVDAPPEAVWEHVVAFAELPPPTELLFRAGVAYPLRAEIHGTGPGAIRHCVFSTGPFVEPIEVWDEPQRLEFSVSAQPPSMRELSPYPELAPPHLESFLVSQRGQFVLEPLAGGRTRLEGTTWYTNRMWPASYWRLWSDEVIHRIHLRVLEHIRERAEES
ncbi:MAG: hypothetical protein ACKVXR_09555 [Planctomycetota bacterium]